MNALKTDRRRGSRRRTTGRRHADSHWTAGPFKINDLAKTAHFKKNTLQLSPKEYALLKLLISNHDRVVSSEEILAELWPHNSDATKTDVAQYIHLLRKKIIASEGSSQLIGSVRGFGYKLSFE